MAYIAFFFSSRRQHTRCLSDWSSDVCSSDLRPADIPRAYHDRADPGHAQAGEVLSQMAGLNGSPSAQKILQRSEERRVGKECSYSWAEDLKRKKGTARVPGIRERKT